MAVRAWITASGAAPTTALRSASASSASAMAGSAPRLSMSWRLSGDRVSPTTECPCSTRSRTRGWPSAPVAPATKTRTGKIRGPHEVCFVGWIRSAVPRAGRSSPARATGRSGGPRRTPPGRRCAPSTRRRRRVKMLAFSSPFEPNVVLVVRHARPRREARLNQHVHVPAPFPPASLQEHDGVWAGGQIQPHSHLQPATRRGQPGQVSVCNADLVRQRRVHPRLYLTLLQVGGELRVGALVGRLGDEVLRVVRRRQHRVVLEAFREVEAAVGGWKLPISEGNPRRAPRPEASPSLAQRFVAHPVFSPGLGHPVYPERRVTCHLLAKARTIGQALQDGQVRSRLPRRA